MKRDRAHYQKVFSDVEKKDFVSLYLLHGSETFIMEEMVSQIVSAVVPADLRAFNLATAHGGGMDVDAFIATASSFPFLTEYRVLILRELEKLRGGWSKLVSYCENPAPASIVIFLYSPFDEWGMKMRPARDFKTLEAAVKKRGKAIPFERLSDGDLALWVRQKGKKLGVELDAGAADALIRSVGGNLFELRNEIEKLALMFDGRAVNARDLAAVIGSYRLDALYDLVDRIRPGEGARTIPMLQRIIRTGAERPSTILYHLTRHFLALLRVKAGIGGQGWVPDSVRSKVSVFTMREIIVWLENLRRAELVLKSSSFPEETLLVGVFVHALNGSCIEYPVTGN